MGAHQVHKHFFLDRLRFNDNSFSQLATREFYWLELMNRKKNTSQAWRPVDHLQPSV